MSLREQLERQLSGTYTIERELDGGGMSRVFVAEERALRRKVVIKLLPPEMSAGLSVDRFQREIQLAATLQHPHIVPLISAGEVDGMPYFTMPLVEGQSLRALLNHGELPVAEVVSILRDITRALVYAHSHGVVHRDIKPDNVLLSAHAATVTDFGVAKALTQAATSVAPLTDAGVALGTPAYMSPEQATADPNIDARADLYALGVLAYEMLTGQTPFAGRSAQQILAAQVTEVPRAVSQQRDSVPAPLSDLIARCLAKRPADRPRSAEEVLHALDALSASTAAAPQATSSPPSPSRRRAILTGGTVVAAVALALILTWHPWTHATATPPPATAQQGAAPRPAAFRPSSIVVAPFANLTGDTSLNVLGAIAAQSLSDGLSRLDSVVVMSAGAGQLIDSTGALRRYSGADAARALGRESKAATVAWGSFEKEGDSLKFQAQVIDVNDGRVRITLDAIHAPRTSPSLAIDELRDRLVNTIDAARLQKEVGSMGRSPNAASYREFLAGLYERFDNPAGTFPSALAHFERAARLDTTFLMASYYVVQNHVNIALNVANPQRRARENRAADSALKALLARTTAATAVEQDLLDDARALAHGDFDNLLRVEQRMQLRDSSLRMVGNLAIVGLWSNHPRATVAAVKAWPETQLPLTQTNIMVNECVALHALGDYEGELKAVHQWQLLGAQDSAFIVREVFANVGLGRLTEVKRLIDSMDGVWDWSSPVTPTGWSGLANELEAHGHDAEAATYIARALAAYAEHPPAATPAAQRSRDAARALMLLQNGHADSAEAIYTRLAATDSLWQGPRVSAAIAAAFNHDTLTALLAITTLDSLGKDPFDHGRYLVGAARIAGALGRGAEAVHFLERALAAGVAFNEDWHREHSFAPIRNYAPFKDLLKPKG